MDRHPDGNGNDPIGFGGQVAIVTGAGRGLGRAYALELARRGARVVVNDVGRTDAGEARADIVAQEIRDGGGEAEASLHDISTEQGGQAIVDAATARFGTLDVLVNNAGFLRPSMFDDLAFEDLHDVVGVHLFGAFYVTRPAWRVMREKRYGRIVMTASSSIFGHPGNGNYAAAKAGVLGIAPTLALEGRDHGIKVNSILPVATSVIAERNPLPGPGQIELQAALRTLGDRRSPAAVSAMVVYLASRQCQVSGHAYSAVAGRYARVFLGVSEGWLAEPSDISAENIAREMKTIEDVSKFSIFDSLPGELADVGSRLR